MITILEAIQQATKDADIPNLSFATLQEFNAFHDSFNFEDWPRNVVVSPDINGTFDGTRAAEIMLLQGWILRRIPQDTNDWRSPQVEKDYIAPSRDLARKFIRRLLDSEIVDSQVEQVRYSIKTEYMFLHSHLFGVSYQAQIPIMKNVC